jgi:hypothetical protein
LLALPPASVDRRLAWVAHLPVLLALLRVFAARTVVLLTLDLVVRVSALAVVPLVFLVVVPSKVVLPLRPTATLVLEPLATVGTALRVMAAAAGGDTAMPLLPLPALLLVTPMAAHMPPATMAATTFPRTGEAPIGAFSSAIEVETAA